MRARKPTEQVPACVTTLAPHDRRPPLQEGSQQEQNPGAQGLKDKCAPRKKDKPPESFVTVAFNDDRITITVRAVILLRPSHLIKVGLAAMGALAAFMYTHF